MWTKTFSLERLCGMYIRMETFSGDLLCGMYLRLETILLYNCIFSSTVRISVFERSPVAHNLILPSMCARKAYPRRFLGRVGRMPPSPTLTRWRFRTSSRKGVKNRLYSTDVYQCIISYLAVFVISYYKNLYLLSIYHLYHHIFAELVHLYNLPLYWVCWGLRDPRGSGLSSMGRTDGPWRYKIEDFLPCPDGTLLCVGGKLGIQMYYFLSL